MNATEHVTKLWLESQGFFVMGPICIGHNEIDLLAIKVCPTSPNRKVHVEVSVSGRPGGKNDGTGLVENVRKKFVGKGEKRKIEKALRERLGDDYERWLVIGKVLGSKEGEWVKTGPTITPVVRVIPFGQVVKEYIQYAACHPAPADQIGKLLDNLRCLGLLALD